jgi:hypothetical protein
MTLSLISPAQCVGYIVLVLGVAAYSQRVDRRLKFLDAMQNIAYSAHFYLLANPAAAASALVACACSLTALKPRVHSLYLALGFIAANLVAGLVFCTHFYQMFASFGSCLVAWAMFRMKGIPMRVVILGATVCWLVNDVLSGSIGGTVLEVFIATANTTTIVRLMIQQRRAMHGANAI